MPWTRDEDAAQPIFRHALDLGITFWDTANVYGAGTSEEIVGRAIKQLTTREQIVLATKVFWPMHVGPGGGGLSRKAILEQVDASLRRLDTDYVDLLQIHRFDPDVPVEETMEALHDVVKAGKARYLGASSMWAWHADRLDALGLESAREARDLAARWQRLVQELRPTPGRPSANSGGVAPSVAHRANGRCQRADRE